MKTKEIKVTEKKRVTRYTPERYALQKGRLSSYIISRVFERAGLDKEDFSKVANKHDISANEFLNAAMMYAIEHPEKMVAIVKQVYKTHGE